MFEKNLKYYRLMRNMSKKELAEKCDITPMAITNYEKGDRTPDIDIINKLAKALDVGIADFLASRNTSLKFVHGEFRKTTALTKAQQAYVEEAVEEYFGRFFDVVEYLGGNPIGEPRDIHCIKATGDYEHDAVELRRELGMSMKGPLDDLINALENLGILVFVFELDNRHFFGMNGTVNGYPYIVVNKKMTTERMRSTIAHELTHIMFDISSIKDPDFDEEKYATAVSGAFLITAGDITREIGLHRRAITKDLLDVCKEYGISMMLLVKRLSQRGTISLNIAQAFYIKASKVGWRTDEPSRIEEETPVLFKQFVYRAIIEEGISIQKGAELLKIPYKDVESDCALLEV